MANPKPTPAAGDGNNRQRGTLPWERAEPAIKGVAGNGGLTDTANAHALQQIKGRIHRRLLERLNLSNLDRLDRAQVIDRIVSAVGRRIDDSSPMVDARLPDGSRVNAIIKPLALDGPHLSIRKFKRDALSGEDLLRTESLTEPMLELLRGIVRARLNVLISGGTGAGKTTLLNIMSSFIPTNERVLTIEDSAELQLKQPHVVRLETRPANIEGSGEVPQRLLLVNALRMR